MPPQAIFQEAPIQVLTLPYARAAEVTDVLCDAFFDYPVMRSVLGRRRGYRGRLETLVGFFVANRVAKEELLLGVPDDSGALVAAALVNLPVIREPPPWLAWRREEVWADLGAEERARYEAFGRATAQFEREDPHHHLGMIGVLHSHHGKGLGRLLLEQVHAVAAADPGSSGVSLSTEVARNVKLYEHFDYRVAGHTRISPDLETWVMFRDRNAGGKGRASERAV